jgi:MFS family permease
MTLSQKPGIAEDSCLKNHSTPSLTSPTDDRSHEAGALNKGSEKGRTPPRYTTNPPPPSDQDYGNSTDEEAADDFPEGGLNAWLVVLGSWCAMVQIFGLINTSGIFESYFKTHQLQDYSHSQIGWIFSLYLFVVFFIGVQVGPVFDRYGPRLLVAVGSLLVVTSLMLLSLSTKYYQIILTYSVMGGLGGALLNTPAYGAIAHFFNVRRGLATGVASTAGGLGGLIFPLLLRQLLGPTGVGFAWSCRIMGFIMLGLSVPANLFIKTRLNTKHAKGGPATPSSIWPDLRIFRNGRFALASAGYFFMEWGLFVPLTYVISYGTAHGISTADSSLMLALLNAGSVVGRLLPGLLADKFGRFNVIIVTIALCVITVLGIWVPCGGSRPVLIAFCVLFGVASGSNLSLIPVCLGQFCESQHFGRYYASATMLASFGTLSSVPIAGALLEVGEPSTGWMATILFSGFSYAVALVCYGAARVMTVGWKPQTKF